MKTQLRLAHPVFHALTLILTLSFIAPARRSEAAVKLGAGNASLLGEDLTDPEDDIKDRAGVDYGQGKPEDTLKPENAGYISMTMGPAYVPGTPPHQMHPYQSWQGSPACMIFMNKPESRKWYIGFKDGGKGGPTKQEPYYCAVQLKEPAILTHFTITSSMDSPHRDPLTWSIQGSNSGRDGEWVDIFKWEGTDRKTCVFPEAPRSETTLFTSFTTAKMPASVNPANLPGLQAKLEGKNIDKPDFTTPAKPYTWFRVVIYSCINANSMQVADFNHPPGFALGQLELFGFNASTRPGTKVPPKSAAAIVPIKLSPLKPPVSDLPFLISYWCGPPKDPTTVERYREIAEAGFNVAFPAIDALWSPRTRPPRSTTSFRTEPNTERTLTLGASFRAACEAQRRREPRRHRRLRLPRHR